MMGVGKSTIGRLVAEHTACGFFDTDAEVVATTGVPIADLWTAEGEEVFRGFETAAITTAAELDGPTVVATGGGAVLASGNVVTMKGSGVVVWLTAPPFVLAERIVTAGGAGRPLLAGADPVLDDADARLAAILEGRRKRYEAAADHILATEGRTIDAVAGELEELWRPM
jgi:shikimate kinase